VGWLDAWWPTNGDTAEAGEGRRRSHVIGLALVVLCTYAYFLPRPAWNQNSRLALTRAIVEHRSLAIDDYHATTGDKSFRDGHFYCDKAPGASLLAVPAYAVYAGFRRVTGTSLPRARVIPLDSDQARAGREVDVDDMKPGDRVVFDLSHQIALWVCNLGSTVWIAGLGLLAVYWLARGLSGVPPPAAHVAGLTAMLTYGLATPAFVYATSFYGHRLCADLLAIGVALVFIRPGWSSDAADDARAGWLVGTALGWAVLCEYPAALPVLGIAALAFGHRGVGFGLRVMAAGAVWAAVLAAYHALAFGHPLATGYDFVYLPEFAEGMKINYGLRAPDPRVLLQLTFGSYRGLFYLAPITLLCVWGLAAGTRRRLDRPGVGEPPTLPLVVVLTCAGVMAYYLALNSGYYMWDGGAAFGPRHCVPMLPLLALGGVVARTRLPFAFFALFAVSAMIMALGAAAGPEAPGHGDPIWAYALHVARNGGAATAASDGAVHNAGHLLGLRGLWSLLPLVLLWVTMRPWRVPDDD